MKLIDNRTIQFESQEEVQSIYDFMESDGPRVLVVGYTSPWEQFMDLLLAIDESWIDA